MYCKFWVTHIVSLQTISVNHGEAVSDVTDVDSLTPAGWWAVCTWCPAQCTQNSLQEEIAAKMETYSIIKTCIYHDCHVLFTCAAHFNLSMNVLVLHNVHGVYPCGGSGVVPVFQNESIGTCTWICMDNMYSLSLRPRMLHWVLCRHARWSPPSMRNVSVDMQSPSRHEDDLSDYFYIYMY